MAETVVRIGCSGWSYPEWHGSVYPTDVPRRRWFETYTRWFDTVELDSTFYGMPTASTVDRWRESAPVGFEYAVKMSSYVTHRRKLRDPDEPVARHADRFRGLGAALGATLVQLPPRWRRDVPRLAAFLETLPRDLSWAVELRDESWFDDEVFDLLGRHRVALCLHDMVPSHPVVVTADHAYLRCHGPRAPHEPYTGRYPRRRMEHLTELVTALAEQVGVVRCYFNNDIGGAAVADARSLLRRLARRGLTGPGGRR